MAAACWVYIGDTAFGQIPWEDEKESVLLENESQFDLSRMQNVGEGFRNVQPRVAWGGDGKPWVTWVGEEDERDHVFVTSFDGNSFSEAVRLSDGTGQSLYPRIAPLDDKLVIAFVTKNDEMWKLSVVLFNIKDSTVEKKVELLEIDRPILNPHISVSSENHILVLFEEKQSTFFAVQAVELGEDLSEVNRRLIADEGGDCRRPTSVADKKGSWWIAWDQQSGVGSKTIYLAWYRQEGSLYPLKATHHPAMNIAPTLAMDQKGRPWVAWQSNRKGTDQWDIPRWFYLRCLDNDRFFDPVVPPKDKNLEKEGTDQSFEFPQVHCAPDGKVLITGRPSHNFCIQYYEGDSWSGIYRLPQEGWGGRGQYLDSVYDPEGNLWVVRRDLRANVLQKISGLAGEQTEPVVAPTIEGERVSLALTNIHKSPDRWDPLTELEGIDEDLYAFYGDLHGHTWMSDGMGDVDEYYITRRDYYQDDFAALTDHDSFVGKSISLAEWEMQKELAEHFQEDGRFVTFFAQEWTTGRYPNAAGHKCIYTNDKGIPLFDHTKEAYRRTSDIYPLIKKWNGLVFPHHTGWTGTDWENCDPEIQTLAEIVSNHGCFEYMGNTPITHRGGARGCFLQDALAKGHRFGFIGGSDSHGLIWHHHAGWKRDCNRTGLAAVLAPDLSRKSILEAMKKRRTFATTGVKARLDFRVNDHLMGEEIVVEEGPIKISFDVTARQDIKWITVVKNNQNWYTYGGEGYRSRNTVMDEDFELKNSFYYLRVEFEDGNMAWSSPVWVDV